MNTEKWRKFIESPESLNYWTEGSDGTWSRGIPNKVPFEIRKHTVSEEDLHYSRHYWHHYGFKRAAGKKYFKDFE